MVVALFINWVRYKERGKQVLTDNRSQHWRLGWFNCFYGFSLAHLKKEKVIESCDLPFVGWSGFCKITRAKWFASWITCFNNSLAWKIHIQHNSRANRLMSFISKHAKHLLFGGQFCMACKQIWSFEISWNIGFSDFQRIELSPPFPPRQRGINCKRLFFEVLLAINKRQKTVFYDQAKMP